MKALKLLFPICLVSGMVLLIVTGLINGTPKTIFLTFVFGVLFLLTGFVLFKITKIKQKSSKKPYNNKSKRRIEEFEIQNFRNNKKNVVEFSEEDWLEVYEQACMDLEIASK